MDLDHRTEQGDMIVKQIIEDPGLEPHANYSEKDHGAVVYGHFSPKSHKIAETMFIAPLSAIYNTEDDGPDTVPDVHDSLTITKSTGRKTWHWPSPFEPRSPELRRFASSLKKMSEEARRSLVTSLG